MVGTAIPRVSLVGLEDSLAAERARLAEKAATVLGYRQLAKVVNGVATLTAALRKLGIDPLHEGKVEEYKQSKRKKGMWSGTKTSLLMWLIPISVICFAVHQFVVDIRLQEHGSYHFGLGMIGIVGGIFSILFAGSATADGWGEGTRKVTDWAKVAIQAYAGDIPEYVLSRAIAVKEECPTANLYVEFLETRINEYHRVRLPDPFLIAENTDRITGLIERAYIDVWNEKEYERTSL